MPPGYPPLPTVQRSNVRAADIEPAGLLDSRMTYQQRSVRKASGGCIHRRTFFALALCFGQSVRLWRVRQNSRDRRLAPGRSTCIPCYDRASPRMAWRRPARARSYRLGCGSARKRHLGAGAAANGQETRSLPRDRTDGPRTVACRGRVGTPLVGHSVPTNSGPSLRPLVPPQSQVAGMVERTSPTRARCIECRGMIWLGPMNISRAESGPRRWEAPARCACHLGLDRRQVAD